MREHAKAVRDAGNRVVVLHLAGASPKLDGNLWAMEEELDPTLSEGIESHHVIHHRVGTRGAAYPLYLWSAVGAYRHLRNRGFCPDVIHAHVYGAAVPAALIGRRSRIPLVVTEHFSGIAQRSLNSIEARKARYAYSRAARILPVSRFLQEAIRSYGIDGPFEVVPNVVDTGVFFPPNGKAKTGTTRRLLFVGNLEASHVKGFPTLLHALTRLRDGRHDWQLDVIGDGAERLHHERTTAELGLDKYVIFHRSQPKTVVAQTMREADLLVLPSRIETFGAVVAEALASGLPVVSTKVGGIPELVDERSGRLVPPDDPVALARALEAALDELETFDSAALSASARRRYGSEVVGEQLGRIYEGVVAKSHFDASTATG